MFRETGEHEARPLGYTSKWGIWNLVEKQWIKKPFDGMPRQFRDRASAMRALITENWNETKERV